MNRALRLAAWSRPLLAVLMCACSLAPRPTTPAAAPTGTTLPATGTLPPATPSPVPTATGPASQPTLAAQTATPPIPAPTSRPVYQLAATLDGQAHTLEVTAHITVTVPAADELVFNFNLARTDNRVELESVEVNGETAVANLESAWLRVRLPPSVEPGGLATVRLAYRVNLVPIPAVAWGWRSTLGWTPLQTNLGDWYPVLAVYEPGDGWQTPTPSVLGEYHTTPAADVHVRLSLTGYESRPRVAGSGTAQPCAPDFCFTLTEGRFAAYVVSEHMEAASEQTADGVRVESVYFPEDAQAGQAALKVAVDALQVYSSTFGAYAIPTFTLVEGDFYDGMEYSGMSFVGRSYYTEYDGTPRNWLTLITAHEVAHQWWHTHVGNDPAHHPWLDEALSTYSELIYLEAVHPDSVPWWWAFRVNGFAPTAAVDQPVYAFSGFRSYVDAVYLRGAQMLHAMRQAVGDERFFACLRAYAEAQAGSIAAPADFWQAYAAVGGDPQAIRSQYFSP